MAMMANGDSRSGIVQAPKPGPLKLALDLWRARGSFRGFAEFALIGAIVLAFVPGRQGPNVVGQLAGLVTGSGGSQHAAPRAGALPKFGGTNPMLAPRLGDLTMDRARFETAPEPLRSSLMAAFDAFQKRDAQGVVSALESADGDDSRVLLMRGLGQFLVPGPTSIKAGIDFTQRAADKGDSRAMAVLGILRISGALGLGRDVKEGHDLLMRAAAGGDGPAARVLAEGYISGWAGGVDPSKAVHYMRLAADLGDRIATFRLGEILYTGKGVAKDEVEGRRLIEVAANDGESQAQAMLGVMDLLPFGAGLTDDPSTALLWLEKAAARNEPNAMYYLGLFFMEFGRRIGRLDPVRAADLFRRCTEATRDSQCRFAYATALDLGIGTPRDAVRAFAMYSLVAAEPNNPKATRKRDDIGNALTADEKRRAAALIASEASAAKPSQSAGKSTGNVPGVSGKIR